MSLVLLGAVAALWGATSLSEASAALDPSDRGTSELASLEDAFALDPSNPEVARRLADRYMRIHEPRQAVNALSSAHTSVREDPQILRILAMAYEETGRMNDALATARLARARCARALGTSDSSRVTPLPTYGCRERTYAALDMHVAALEHMTRWGVTDVQHDARARQAYVRAVRSARILSAHAE